MKEIKLKNKGTTGRDKWLSRFHEIFLDKLATGTLDNKAFATQLRVSERHLFRLMKVHTNLTPQQYIRQCRLQQAMHYLEAGTYRTVKETAQAIGYANASHFIRHFQQEFGKKPLDVLREWGWR